MALPFPLLAGVAHVTLHANAAGVWVLSNSSNKCNKNKLQSSSTTPALVMPSYAPLPSSLPQLLTSFPFKSKEEHVAWNGRAKRATHYFLLYAFFSFAFVRFFFCPSALLWSGHSATSRRRRGCHWGSHAPGSLARAPAFEVALDCIKVTIATII